MRNAALMRRLRYREHMSILRPRRVYFDTANLYDLAKESVSSPIRTELSTAVAEGRLIIVLSVIHCIEIARKPHWYRNPLVNFLDILVDSHAVVWVRSSHPVLHLEMDRARSETGPGPLHDDEMFSSHPMGVLRSVPPGAPHGDVERNVVATTIATIEHGTTLHRYQDNARQWAESMEKRRQTRLTSRAPGKLTEQTRLDIATYTSPPPANATHADEYVVPDTRSMPAHTVWFAYEEGAIRGGTPVTNTDREDLMHLLSGVYADMVFVDKRTWERLRVGGWESSKARKNVSGDRLVDFLRSVEPFLVD